MVKKLLAMTDPQLGDYLAKRRKQCGILAKFVAIKMGIGANSLCMLEKGQRKWNRELISAYLEAIGEPKKKCS